MRITKIAAVVALLLGAGCGRPLAPETPCARGSDCQSGDWCVFTWWDTAAKVPVPTEHLCLQGCASDAECESGCCAPVGDAVGAAGTGPHPSQVYTCAPRGSCPR